MRPQLSAISGAMRSAIEAFLRRRITIDEGKVGHIFRSADGHFPTDTLAARRVLLRVANDPTKRLGVDRFKAVWAAETMPDGTQIWVQIRDGRITNDGVNRTPRVFNISTGLSSRPGHGREP